jgi:cytochrome c1
MKRLIAIALLALACHREPKSPTAKSPAAGNPAAGKVAMEKYSCGTCHIIPGIDGARGMLGPSLEHFRTHPLLGGKLPNKPETMIQWIQNPQALDPQGTMPNLGVTEDDARDIAAYVYSLP